MKKSMLNLSGKVVLVTGGSQGLGSIICKELSLSGAKVILHYNSSEKKAKNLKKEIKGNIEIIKADLNKNKEIKKLIKNSINFFGPINILINCAAFGSKKVSEFSKISKELWEKTQKINIQAPLILIQEFSKQKQAETIVNISSIESLIPSKNHEYYSISKSALNMVTKSAAQEYGHLGIRINSISPGLLFRNNIEKDWPSGVKNWQDKSPMKKLVNPKDVANTAIFLASDFSHSINGENIIVDTGMSCVQAW